MQFAEIKQGKQLDKLRAIPYSNHRIIFINKSDDRKEYIIMSITEKKRHRLKAFLLGG